MRSTRRYWLGLLAAVIPTLLLATPLLAGCGLAAPSPTPTPIPTTQILRPVSTATRVAMTPSPSPTRAPASTPTPYDLGAALGIPPLDTLLAKSENLTEYTFNYKVIPEEAGPIIMSGKAYVKGTKLRQELFVQGQRAVIFADSRRALYHILYSDQKTAVKLDLSKIGNQAVNPNESVQSLRDSSRLISAEIMHGESSAVFEVTTPEATLKYWIWVAKGLPLRIEAVAKGQRVILDFSDYRFGAQSDMLFELPPGTKIVEAATSQPTMPNTGPAIPTPSKTY